eukprot:TRINITY_DN5146_c0_g1_i1.p2 TRINITY_DN5146_c0_g1~~TRINITY_DN5146_c0_g1_i1.p2  ORF type:complete len:243 (+),score=110.61 TRINITY_DN5146_c0_g1_i1:55-729(+)
MPKNKKQRTTALTQTKPKGMDHKEDLVNKIREAADAFESCYTFDLKNLRTTHLTAVRREFSDSRIFMGNNKVMAVALGRAKEDSYKENLFKLAKRLTGSCGLLFTNRPKKEVKEFFSNFSVRDFARAGIPSSINWTIAKGPLTQFGHEMMDQLSKLGLPVKLDHGTLVLLADTKVAEEDEPLSSEASQLMKLWGIQSVSFRILLTAHWADGLARAIAPPKAETA